MEKRFGSGVMFLVCALFAGTLCGDLSQAKDKGPKHRCDRTPTGIETTDYWLPFVTENMPDPKLNDLPAEIRVHRVKPVYANGKCPGVPNHTAVLVHGRSVAATPTFDVEHPDVLSTQKLLARAGVDTFAPDLLGYGYSSRLSLDDPCNASYPGYAANGSCTALDGRCDRSPHPAVSAVDQQRTQLKTNPLQPILQELGTETCEHSSDKHFANNDNWARDIIQVMEDAIEKSKPRGKKVTLIGYSLGGIRVGRTLYLLGEEAEHLVKKVVFWASLFNLAPNGLPDTLPTEESQDPAALPTFPLSVGGFGGLTSTRGTASQVTFCGGTPTTAVPDPSRNPPGMSSAFRQQHRDLEDPTQDPRYPDGDWQDLFGLDWGGTVFGSPTGLNRLPTFTRYGWNPDIAHTFTLPTLVLNGVHDNLVIVENSTHIFNELTSVAHKVLVQVECGTHQMQIEICGADGDGDGVPCEVGERCCTAEPGTIYGSDSDTWDGPYSTVAAALVEWIKEGTFNDSKCGHFVVNASGVANEVETPHCPPPDDDDDDDHDFSLEDLKELIRDLLKAWKARLG